MTGKSREVFAFMVTVIAFVGISLWLARRSTEKTVQLVWENAVMCERVLTAAQTGSDTVNVIRKFEGCVPHLLFPVPKTTVEADSVGSLFSTPPSPR